MKMQSSFFFLSQLHELFNANDPPNQKTRESQNS